MTIEDLLAEVTKRGLRLNNLFQLEGGSWQANVTDGERYWEFGKGETAIAALLAALHISATDQHSLGIAQTNRVANMTPGQRARLLAGSL